MLDNLLTRTGVNLVLKQYYNQTLCVKYYTEMILGSFGIGQVNKADTICHLL